MDFPFSCLSEHYKIIRLLVVCINLTSSLILLFCCNHWLIKEPVIRSPFKLVFKVIKYAIKNKYPQERSAFTYCEDDLPSRIDFGKMKCGGPFTTEQVEDVKTFLRLLPVATIGGILISVVTLINYLRNKLGEQFTNFSESDLEDVTNSKTVLAKCYTEASFTHTMYSSATVLIVLNELFLYPVFHRCCPKIESLQKALIGTILQLVRVLVLMMFDVISRQTFAQHNNSTIQCIFYEIPSALSTSFNYHWLVIPDLLYTITITMLFIGTVEFVSAQVPYFVKGLIAGIVFCSLALSGAVWYVVSIPFTQMQSIWGTGTITCGFWYALLLAVVQMIALAFFVLLTRWYKKRKRGDVLPNEHIFAENYYSSNSKINC